MSGRCSSSREAAVEAEAELQVGDVAVRDQHRGAERDLRAPLVLRLADVAALERRDRFLEHGLIQLEADLADVAGLLLAQQVAATADVEVVAGEREAGAQRVERLQHLEALLGALGQPLAVRAW